VPGDVASSRVRWIPAAIAFTLTCASLAWGAGFDLDPFDSAELALAAVTRGLAHPPGQPLHTLVGWLLTRLPFRPLAVLAWLSIAPAAAMVTLAADPFSQTERRGGEAGSGGTVAVVAAGLVFAALPDVRSVACRIEVYALAALFGVLAVVLASNRTPKHDLVAGISLGLAACANPVLAAQGIGALAAAWRSTRRENALAIARIAGGAVLGLAPYVYVVAVASRVRDTLVWGAPADGNGWMRLLTAADFRRNVSASPGTLVANAAHFAIDAARRGALVVVVAGIVAASLDRRGERWRRVTAIVASLALGEFMVAANVPYLANNPDYGGYLLVPIALSLHALVDAVSRVSRKRIAWASAAVIAATALALGIAQRGPRGITRMLATEVLTAAPDHAIVVLGSDHLLFPALYMQRVEGLRDDVTILNPGWASARWAWLWAQAHDPALRVDYAPSRGDLRLNRALAARAPGRAVMAESPAALAVAAPGPVCLRGLLWSSGEGCIGARRWIQRARNVLTEASLRAKDHGWDARLVYFTGRSLGDGARSLGCAGLASILYRAARGDDEGPFVSLHCSGEPLLVPPPASLLDVTRADLPGDSR
jgi:hypothetical protein